MAHRSMMAATFWVGLAVALSSSAARAQTVTPLVTNGNSADKLDIVIVGDGFQSGNQAAFDTYVDNVLVNQVFTEGPLGETLSAFNIVRVNVDSVDGTLTQVDANGVVRDVTGDGIPDVRNTALGYRYSGEHPRCWFEPADATDSLTTALLDSLVPQRDFTIVVLNEARGGGCRRGNTFGITIAESWLTSAHEAGHMVGNLCDEYIAGTAGMRTYNWDNDGDGMIDEPVCVNVTSVLAPLKWSAWLDPATTVPTVFNAATMDGAATIGAFVGATTSTSGWDLGIWRASNNSRMNSNAPAFNPVSYDQMRNAVNTQWDHNFSKTYVGDFNGDGRDDLVVHNAGMLELYLSDGTHEAPTWFQSLPMPGWDRFMPNDTFYVTDFDNDGNDDLYVVNLTDWAIPYVAMLRSTGIGFQVVRRYDGNLPGWQMQANDKFYAGDFDADGRGDLYVTNTRDWAVGYLGMLRSTGSELVYVQRYDDILPGWDHIKGNDKFYPADVDGDGRRELHVFNYGDWAFGYLLTLRSTGTGLEYVRRYDKKLPGWDDLLAQDQLIVADHDGDGDDDLYLFNGPEWRYSYLAKVRSDGGQLVTTQLYGEIPVPGWDRITPGDRFLPGDANGDGRVDLFVYNAQDWDSEYLGILISEADILNGSWQKDFIGAWDLVAEDAFFVADFNGAGGLQDLVIARNTRDAEWLGLLRSQGRQLMMSVLYKGYIHDHPYHVNGWW